MIKFDGKLSISRTSSNNRDLVVTLTVEDAASRCCVLELEITPEEFMLAIFSQYGRPCVGEFFHEAPVGCRHEHKTEVVAFPGGEIPSEKKEKKKIRAAVAAFETDGWLGRDEDMFNSHNWVRRDGKVFGCGVHYHRHVRPDGSVWSEPLEVARG